uniref:Uncharacterized protein n=1 Tax=Oryza barthii TaxID=65489 RepID=A0A0D3GDS2_9ORYZ
MTTVTARSERVPGIEMSSSPWDHANERLHHHFILPGVLAWRRCRSCSPRLDAAAAFQMS